MIVGLLIRPTNVRVAIDHGDITIPFALFGSATIAIILYMYVYRYHCHWSRNMLHLCDDSRASYSSPGYVEGPAHFEYNIMHMHQRNTWIS
jgi:hypothetical protein